MVIAFLLPYLDLFNSSRIKIQSRLKSATKDFLLHDFKNGKIYDIPEFQSI